jgi:hypothetical protein
MLFIVSNGQLARITAQVYDKLVGVVERTTQS